MKQAGQKKNMTPDRLKPATNPRLLAVRVLSEVFRERATPKISLDDAARSLERRDRAFLMEIVYGVLRNRDTLDWILGHFVERPSRLGDFTMNNLRAAVYQIYYMRVPDFAVVHESVVIEKSGGKPSVVNGVLRSLLRKRDACAPPIACDDPIQSLALNTSHPKWLIKRWVRRFGLEEAAELCRVNNEIPALTLRANTLRVSRDDLIRLLADKDISAIPTRYSPDGIILKDIHSPLDLPDFRGLFTVQGEASQLISYLLGPKPGERILDACAAPGGKTTHIAQLMEDRGEIVAVEQDRKRIARLTGNINVLGIRSVRVVTGDLHELRDIGTFDRVLLDAPCSALGVIGKNPDVKYRRRPEDLIKYHDAQARLLLTAAELLKEQGTIVYSVCSMEPEEGDDVVAGFLKTKDDFRIIETDDTLLHGLKDGGILRVYPQRQQMDGFFGAALCRIK